MSISGNSGSSGSGVRMSFIINNSDAINKIKELADAFKTLVAPVEAINAAIEKFNASEMKSAIANKDLTDQVMRLTAENTNLKNSVDLLNKKYTEEREKTAALKGAMEGLNKVHKEELRVLKESSNAKVRDNELLMLAQRLVQRQIKSINELTYAEKKEFDIAKQMLNQKISRIANQARISNIVNDFVGDLNIQGRSLSKFATKLGSITGLYEKHTGNFRGYTTGFRRSIGALRNNILLVTFAISGFVTSIMTFIKNAAMFDSALTGLTEVSGAMGQSMIKSRDAAINMSSEGLLTIQESAAGLKNLLATGLNLEQSRKLMIAFTDAASYNRQGTLTLGEAVVGATQGFKNMQCLSGDTEILDLTDGKFYTLKDLHDNKKRVPCVLSVDRKTGKMIAVQASYIHYNGKRDVYEVELENGQKIKSTDNHRYLTPDGFKFLFELNEGDIVYYVDDNKIKEKLDGEIYCQEESAIINNEPVQFVMNNSYQQTQLNKSVKNVAQLNVCNAEKNLQYTKKPLLKNQNFAVENVKENGTASIEQEKILSTIEMELLLKKLNLNVKTAEKYLNFLEVHQKDEIKDFAPKSAFMKVKDEESLIFIVESLLKELFIYVNGVKKNTKNVLQKDEQQDFVQNNVEMSGNQKLECQKKTTQIGKVEYPNLDDYICHQEITKSGENTVLKEINFDVYDAIDMLKEALRYIILYGYQKTLNRDYVKKMELLFAKSATKEFIQNLNTVLTTQLQITPISMKIVKITWSGIEDVYDLTVPECYNLLSNKIITHNSIMVDNCFVEDTLVCTENGNKKIGNIVINKIKTKVWSYNLKTKKKELKSIINWHDNGIKPVFKLKTKNGHEFIATETHNFYTPNGNKIKLNELKTGDKIAICSKEKTIQDIKEYQLQESEIESIEFYGYEHTYNITVEDNHNYFVIYDDLDPVLSSNSGITKNLSIMWQEYARQIGTTEGKLTDQQKIQAQYLGILKESEKFEGNRLKYLKDFQGTLSKMRVAWIEFSAVLGNVFLPVAEKISNSLFKIFESIGFMTKQGEIEIKSKLVGSFLYLKDVVNTLIYPLKAFSSLLKVIVVDMIGLNNTFNLSISTIASLSIGTWALARAITFLVAVFDNFNKRMVSIWTIATAINIAFYLLRSSTREYVEKIIELNESLKNLTSEKILYNRSLLNEQLMSKEVIMNNEGEIISYGKLKDKITENIGELQLYLQIQEQISSRKMISDILLDLPKKGIFSYIKDLGDALKNSSAIDSKGYNFEFPINQSVKENVKTITEEYNKILDISKKLSLNKDIFSGEGEKQATAFAGRIMGLVDDMNKLGIGSEEAIGKLTNLAIGFANIGHSFSDAGDQIKFLRKQIAGIKNASDEVKPAGEKIKTTMEQIFSMLPKFSDLKYEDIGGPIIDTIFTVKLEVIQEQAKKISDGLKKAISEGTLNAKTDVKAIVENFVAFEKSAFIESYYDFVDKVTPSIEKAIDELFKSIEKMGKSKRRTDFILQYIGGAPAAKLEQNIADDLYNTLSKAIKETDERLMNLGTSFELEFNISKDAALSELAYQKAIQDTNRLISEKMRVIEEMYVIKEQAIKLNNIEALQEIEAYERKKSLVELEIELINRKSTAQAVAYDYMYKMHEQIYTSMETVSEAFFNHELRRQLTLTKAVELLLKDQLAFFLDVAAKRIQSKAAEAAIDAGWLTIQGIIYGNPEFFAAAGKMAAIAAGYSALAGTVGGLANAVRSSAPTFNESSILKETGTTSSGSNKSSGSVASGTSAGSITSAGQMTVNIQPSVVFNGQNIYLGQSGSASEIGSAIGNLNVNMIKQAIETGEVDLTRSTRR